MPYAISASCAAITLVYITVYFRNKRYTHESTANGLDDWPEQLTIDREIEHVLQGDKKVQ